MARRKTENVTPDVFQQEGQTWIRWLEANLKLVLGAIVVVLATVIAVEFFESSSQRSAAAVTSDLTEAVEVYQDETELRKVLTTTSAAELKAGYQKAADKLKTFVDAHPNTEAARVADLYYGDILARLEQPAEAAQRFNSYVTSAKPDDELMWFALEGLGYSQEAQNDLDGAAATFDKLATTAPFYKDYGLKHKARVLEAKGDKAGAVTAYQSIVEMDPASPLKPFAETRLKALE